MKATLEFDMDSHVDREEHRWALAGSRAHTALFEIHSDLFRPMTKYGTSSEAHIKKVLEKYPDDHDKLMELADAMHSAFWDLLVGKNLEII